MQLKFTTSKMGLLSFARIFTLSFGLLVFTTTVFSQNYCANETVLWSENFGTGTTTSTNADVVNLTYQPTGDLNDGFYRISNSTRQRSEWHIAPDHTPADVDGKMLVVNGIAETFYEKTITNGPNGFQPGAFAASLYLMNVNTPGTCGSGPLLPSITFQIEYNSTATGTEGWVALQSITINAVPQSAVPTWIQMGGVFNVPTPAQRIRLTLSDGTVSGCGNDFAIDDIQFATCPTGGPLPVDFLSLSAIQKGGGVSVNWSTASESNNKYFDVEKSLDGINWTLINSVNGSMNSSTVKGYNAYDAQPAAGWNYYRIKQVDTDSRYKYSTVVKVKISIEKTGVTVLANPFVNNITVDFLSNKNQMVNVRLTDISGKMVGNQNWRIAKGSTRLSFENIANIQKGMYIFTVVDDNGAVIYNNKLVKQ